MIDVDIEREMDQIMAMIYVRVGGVWKFMLEVTKGKKKINSSQNWSAKLSLKYPNGISENRCTCIVGTMY